MENEQLKNIIKAENLVPGWNQKSTRLDKLDWPKNQIVEKDFSEKVPGCLKKYYRAFLQKNSFPWSCFLTFHRTVQTRSYNEKNWLFSRQDKLQSTEEIFKSKLMILVANIYYN